MNTNPLRYTDPTNPFSPSKLVNDIATDTRKPNRVEPHPSIPDTQLVRPDAVRVYRNAALSVTTNDFITWDALTHDTTGIWNGGQLFTIPGTGKITGPWKIKCQICWPGTGAGATRQLVIIRNGSVLTLKDELATVRTQEVSDTIYDPSRSDVFKIQIYHDAGGALALTVGSHLTFFSLTHIG